MNNNVRFNHLLDNCEHPLAVHDALLALAPVIQEARATFPERFCGKSDRGVKQEIIEFFTESRVNDRPGYLVVASLMCIFARQKGQDISGVVAELKGFTHGDVKRAIKLIRTMPEIQNGDYPIEEMIRLLRCEVMGKKLLGRGRRHEISHRH